jgi:hypothetical protein
MFKLITSLGKWFRDAEKVELIVFGFILLILSLIILSAVLRSNERNDCIKSGGRWVVVGHTTVYRTIFSNKNTLIMPQEEADYGCVRDN